MTTAAAQNGTSVLAEVDGGLGATPKAGHPQVAWAASESGDAAVSSSSLLAAAARLPVSALADALGTAQINRRLLRLQQLHGTLMHSRASCQLLEPYPAGTYVTYPYLGSHSNRVLVIIRYT